jgi:hypothetical protein
VATAFFGGNFFSGEFFSTSATPATAEVGGGHGKPWQQKWRQDLVELLEQEQIKPVEVPRRVRRAIERVLEAAPPDDSTSIKSLRSELESLKVSYQPAYVQALRYQIALRYQAEMKMLEDRQRWLDDDDEDVIALILH